MGGIKIVVETWAVDAAKRMAGTDLRASEVYATLVEMKRVLRRNGWPVHDLENRAVSSAQIFADVARSLGIPYSEAIDYVGLVLESDREAGRAV